MIEKKHNYINNIKAPKVPSISLILVKHIKHISTCWVKKKIA